MEGINSLVYAPQCIPTMDTFFSKTRLRGSCGAISNRIRHFMLKRADLLYFSTGKANNERAAFPSYALQTVWRTRLAMYRAGLPDAGRKLATYHPDRIIDHVDTLSACDLHHFFLPVRLAVIHCVVGASVFDGYVELLLRACCANDLCTQGCGKPTISFGSPLHIG